MWCPRFTLWITDTTMKRRTRRHTMAGRRHDNVRVAVEPNNKNNNSRYFVALAYWNNIISSLSAAAACGRSLCLIKLLSRTRPQIGRTLLSRSESHSLKSRRWRRLLSEGCWWCAENYSSGLWILKPRVQMVFIRSQDSISVSGDNKWVSRQFGTKFRYQCGLGSLVVCRDNEVFGFLPWHLRIAVYYQFVPSALETTKVWFG